MLRDDRRFRKLRRGTAILLLGAFSLFDVAAWAGPPMPAASGFGAAGGQMPTGLREMKNGTPQAPAMQTPNPTPSKGSSTGQLPTAPAIQGKGKRGKTALKPLPAVQKAPALKQLPAVQKVAPSPAVKRQTLEGRLQPAKTGHGKTLRPGFDKTPMTPRLGLGKGSSVPGMRPGFGKTDSVPSLRPGFGKGHVMPDLRPDSTPLPIGGVPGGAMPHGGPMDGRDIRDAARQIREEASRRSSIRLTSLSGFTGYEGQCAYGGESLVIAGYGFGEARGSRQIVLERRGARGSSVAAYVRADSWSDTRVAASVPNGLAEGQTFHVVVLDSSGRTLSNSLAISACRTRGRVVVNMDTSWCAYSTDQVIVEARATGGRVYPLGAMTGSHDFDVVFGSDNLPLGRYSIETRFRGNPCPGGTWSGSPSIHISHDDPLEEVRVTYDVSMTETPLALTVVEGLLRTSFRDLQIRLNNYDRSASGDSRFQAGDAFILLPPALGGRRIPLDLPEIREGAFRYYVQDLNLGGIHVGHVGERFHVRLTFESGGNELKGHCFGDVLDGCLAGPDSSAPDGHINGASVDIYFDAIRYNVGGGTGGDVSIGNVEVSVDADLAVNGILGPLFELIEGEIRGRVIPPLEANLRAQLSTRAFQVEVANGIRAATGGLIGNVQGVDVVGSRLIIRHVPRG
ncbi:MAG: hypothetical protein CL910_02570 [Deltaproteobacteria bacterium]|nr:hypothetical protein [Deltaproteobacteria bacterium]